VIRLPLDRPKQARIIERAYRSGFLYKLIALDGLAPWTVPPQRVYARAVREQGVGTPPLPDPTAYRTAIAKLQLWANQNDWEIVEPL
jgi:hypothetical protein